MSRSLVFFIAVLSFLYIGFSSTTTPHLLSTHYP